MTQKQQSKQADRDAVARDYQETEAAIAEATIELSALVSALEERQRQCQQLGVPCRNPNIGALRHGIAAQIISWRNTRPDLLGVDVPPVAPVDKMETAIIEAQQEVARARRMLGEAEALDEGRRGELSSDKRRMLEVRLAALELAQGRLAQLEEWAEHGKPPRPERTIVQPHAEEVVTIDPGNQARHAPRRMTADWEEA